MDIGRPGVRHFLDGIRVRISAHLDAGAGHACIQALNPSGQFGDLHGTAPEALAT